MSKETEPTIAQIHGQYRELKGDLKETKRDVSEVKSTVIRLCDRIERHLEGEAQAKAKQDEVNLKVGSRVEALDRKVDAIALPSLLRRWKDNWDPILTGLISLLFVALGGLVTLYKDQLLEKMIGFKNEVPAIKTKVDTVQREVKEVQGEVKEVRVRQDQAERGQYAIGQNLYKVMDRIGVPKGDRLPLPNAPPSMPRPGP